MLVLRGEPSGICADLDNPKANSAVEKGLAGWIKSGLAMATQQVLRHSYARTRSPRMASRSLVSCGDGSGAWHPLVTETPCSDEISEALARARWP